MANEMIGKARNLAKSGNYKEAIKLLRGMETGGDELPSALLLLLLCSYQVNTTEERTARKNELLLLINEEEKAILP